MATAANHIINMYAAPMEQTWEALDTEELEITTDEREIGLPIPTVTSRPPGGIALTSDGPRAMGTPTTPRFILSSPQLSPDEISTSFEEVTAESLEQCKREHPAFALDKLVARDRAEIKKELKPKPNPISRKLEIKTRLRNKLEKRKSEEATDVKEEEKPEVKPEPEVKEEPEDFVKAKTPKSNKKTSPSLKPRTKT